MRVIAGTRKGRKLLGPVGYDTTRPTLDRVKEAMFSIIQNHIMDATVVDVFSGTGSLGIEAASRGASKCYLFDRDNVTFSFLKQNIENLKLEDICFSIKGDSYESLKMLANKGEIFDIIFIDPPYAKDMIPPAIEIIEKTKCLREDGIIVCKIDSSEQVYDSNKTIMLSDKRRYGNTTVLIYKYREI
ncbi:16S rRNA (guanine966-N2)-methyltransferase [Hathewaya proteolytica DSM 3090]|uniref:16S rRNA (Guanine966-N2)-methyltransferase n=1 Tax=Hathewaya proteolytica DSM 3090 TaxID=1121331 RepID=A0A1M6J9K9_9CLOT|nr:16S rRNA (guanine(966)-N(2))-methyltransferase RsmD [Hathewaya proteolytica]SHJ43344.1 16S rRNA (guanine966-N2)-methyltransferase [Hathewaya proteolytica DSM 3090]